MMCLGSVHPSNTKHDLADSQAEDVQTFAR
jgi:hypothetical protein